jgi:hypothetical protein
MLFFRARFGAEGDMPMFLVEQPRLFPRGRPSPLQLAVLGLRKARENICRNLLTPRVILQDPRNTALEFRRVQSGPRRGAEGGCPCSIRRRSASGRA